MDNKMKRHLSYRFMPMIILSYLFINLYFIMTGTSWCQSDGCSVSKTLLSIEQTDLYSLAIVVFAGLLLIGLNILKKDSKMLEDIYKFSIFTVMVCETILLSYLYLKTGTLCIVCFIFYLLVIINFMMIGNVTRILIIPFIFIAMMLLDLNTTTSQNKPLTTKFTLIQSEQCEHCKETKAFLDENKIKYEKVDFTSYSGLLSNLNINKIPLLIVKNSDDNILLLNGVSEIKNYMVEYEINDEVNVSKITNSSSSYNTQSNPISLEDKEGCEIDFLKQDLINCK